MFKSILLTTFIICAVSSIAISQQARCDSLMNEPIGSAMANNEEITANLGILLECGNHDDITKKYFSEGYRVFEMMSIDIVRFIGDANYSDVMHFVDSLVQEPVYKEEMWFSVEMERITKEPSTLEVFESNEKFFRKLEPDEVVFEELRTFYKNLGPTEMNIQASFRMFYTEKLKAEKEKEPARKKVSWYYSSFNDVESATAKVEYTDLLVAIYFTGKADINSRKMEEDVLSDSEVNMTLSIQFIAFEAYIDDTKVLSAADQKKFTTYFGETVKTVGQKNSLYLKKFTNNPGTPSIVILDEGGNVVSTTGFTSSPEEFHKFLKSCTAY